MKIVVRYKDELYGDDGVKSENIIIEDRIER
jgi:hypothetical protein